MISVYTNLFLSDFGYSFIPLFGAFIALSVWEEAAFRG